MAFTDPIVLADNAAANQSFTLQSKTQNGSDYIENDATGTDQRKIVIRHTNAGPSVVKGAKPVRRHLVQFTHEKLNATLGKIEKITLNVTLTTDPGASGLVAADIYHVRAFAANFLTTTNIDKLIRDES
jgi:hypothetical protein